YLGRSLCTLFSALSTARISTAVLQTILQMLTARTPTIADKVQAAPSMTSQSGASSGSAGSATNLLSMLTYAADIINAINPDSSSSSTTPSPPIVNRSPLTQVLSALTGATGSSAASSSPLVTVLDMMTSDSSPIKLLANVYNQRKKKPAPDQSAQSTENDVDGGLPPTPCPSLEEYVTPTFARNYQGVWKYVVQIPHEGYLTQTVQQTKCMSSRCDFVEGGLCYESPRWVSLLVAEVFYPHAVFPTTSPQRRQTRPRLPAVHDFHNFQQYLNRRARPGLKAQSRQDANPRPWAETPRGQDTKCDGHDQVGCYVVRMYYDWFLVNGSCKCWKPSGKQMFTGGR
ncbi:unnamed protein product, partial [Ixodes hexagonus]